MRIEKKTNLKILIIYQKCFFSYLLYRLLHWQQGNKFILKKMLILESVVFIHENSINDEKIKAVFLLSKVLYKRRTP